MTQIRIVLLVYFILYLFYALRYLGQRMTADLTKAARASGPKIQCKMQNG